MSRSDLRIFLLSGVCLLNSIAAFADESSPDVRVMSFNIRYGAAQDGDNHWDRRHRYVVDVIRQFDPDLLGTQETLGFQAEFLKTELPHMTSVGSSRDANPGGEQCALLFRTSRFQLLGSGQFWLSDTPETEFSRSWDSSLPRIATWVHLQDLKHDHPVLFLNTHFDHRGQVARSEAAALIRRFVESRPESLPIIVTGDFNCAEDSDPYRTLLGSERLTDTWRRRYPERQPKEGTFNGFQGTSDGARIDWILCSPSWQVLSAEIVRTSFDNRFPSDHFPVSAILKHQTDHR